MFGQIGTSVAFFVEQLEPSEGSISSYPRSGNSFLSQLLDASIGIVTGNHWNQRWSLSSMSRLFNRSMLWGDFLEILSFLDIGDVYRSCGCLNKAGFVAFLREKATRQCPEESASQSRFLCSGLNHEKVLLVSYPRSGNSFLRRLLEASLGVVTGSDSRPNRTLSESLLKCGFKGIENIHLYSTWYKLNVCENSDMALPTAFAFVASFLLFTGEGVVDDSVWMVKTHYPERMGYLKFKVKRVVLLIRNPFDAMESYFHMGMTNTHDKHLSLKVSPYLLFRID